MYTYKEKLLEENQHMFFQRILRFFFHVHMRIPNILGLLGHPNSWAFHELQIAIAKQLLLGRNINMWEL